jgi:hypothetical protein
MTFMRIVAVLAKTIELQAQIDHIYPAIEGQTVHMSLLNHNENEALV